MKTILHLKLVVCAAVGISGTAWAFDGLVASELPPGGDVTVPGEYSISVPPSLDVVFTGMESFQALNLMNRDGKKVTVRIYSTKETKVRLIHLNPGTSAVYRIIEKAPVRMRVAEGSVVVSSRDPLKIQR